MSWRVCGTPAFHPTSSSARRVPQSRHQPRPRGRRCPRRHSRGVRTATPRRSCAALGGPCPRLRSGSTAVASQSSPLRAASRKDEVCGEGGGDDDGVRDEVGDDDGAVDREEGEEDEEGEEEDAADGKEEQDWGDGEEEGFVLLRLEALAGRRALDSSPRGGCSELLGCPARGRDRSSARGESWCPGDEATPRQGVRAARVAWPAQSSRGEAKTRGKATQRPPPRQSPRQSPRQRKPPPQNRQPRRVTSATRQTTRRRTRRTGTESSRRGTRGRGERGRRTASRVRVGRPARGREVGPADR